MGQKIFTLPEAAEYLRMAVPTFREHRPYIGGSKIGRNWCFTETELLAYMERKRSKPLSELKSAS